MILKDRQKEKRVEAEPAAKGGSVHDYDSKMNCFQAQGFLQWSKIRKLYKKAFPRAERKPLSIIRSMQKSLKTDVWFFEKDGRFAGFASTINGDGLILLDYLAVDTACRGMGIGSEILQTIRRQYTGKGVFVEIERVKEGADASDHRWKRKQFYIANGMSELDVAAKVFGVEMELMGWDCHLDFDAYQSFYRDYYSAFAARNLVPIPKE